MLSLQLPADIESRLDDLAKRTGRSPSSFALEAIAEYLGDIEDLYLAEQRLENLRDGKSYTLPLSEIVRRYGLDN